MRLRTVRTAFTLVEMLVVIILILTLAALVVSLTPRFIGTRQLARGAEQLQGYLLMAKSRARRDQLPTGVRLQADDQGLVRIVQMVQQPDWFSGGTMEYNPSVQAGAVRNPAVDFTGGFPDAALYSVQPGDYLEIKGGGLVHRINTVTAHALKLDSVPPNQIFATVDYHIIRRPRILTGETPLELPQDIAIDLSTNGQFHGPIPPTTNGYVDLLFLPGSALADCAGGFCPLWVRDTSQDSIFQGEPRLIVIYPMTGQIAAHPINEDTANPYLFCSDGRSSGL